VNPDWVEDPLAEPVPSDDELEVTWGQSEPWDDPADDAYDVVVGMAYASVVSAVHRSLAMARYLAGDFKCEHDEPVLVAEATLFDVANDTIRTLEAMDLSDDLKADLNVARFFLQRWLDGPPEVHGDDPGDELVPA